MSKQKVVKSKKEQKKIIKCKNKNKQYVNFKLFLINFEA